MHVNIKKYLTLMLFLNLIFSSISFSLTISEKVNLGFEDQRGPGSDQDSQDVVLAINFLGHVDASGGTNKFDSVYMMVKPIMAGAMDDVVLNIKNLCTRDGGLSSMNLEINGKAGCDSANEFIPNASVVSGSVTLYSDLSNAFINCPNQKMVNVENNTLCHGRLTQIQLKCTDGGYIRSDPYTDRFPYEEFFFIQNGNIRIDYASSINNKPNITLYPITAGFALEQQPWFTAYDFSTTVNLDNEMCEWEAGSNLDYVCFEELNNIYDSGTFFDNPGQINRISFNYSRPPDLDLGAFNMNYQNTPHLDHMGIFAVANQAYMGAPGGIDIFMSCEEINGGSAPAP